MIESARAHARAWDHGEVGTGHLLLGLADGQGQGMAGVILRRPALTPDVIRLQVRRR
ncbi:Clp protease N-terminal domain-containing protein [Thermomonospora echinospora]|uniref:Clp protease N-terminal domain-containing protein n=1 Tax=Thermomonospora echinospora TaxID=1992 RepID=UPI00389AB42C